MKQLLSKKIGLIFIIVQFLITIGLIGLGIICRYAANEISSSCGAYTDIYFVIYIFQSDVKKVIYSRKSSFRYFLCCNGYRSRIPVEGIFYY